MIDIDDIHKICGKYNIKNYSINSDGSIDVVGDVLLGNMYLKEIPLKFNKVIGNFDCSDNELTSLNNCPIEVGGWFSCSYNHLTSLESLPKNHKYELFKCYENPLKSLYGFKQNYNILYCDNKRILIKKHKRKIKIEDLLKKF